MIRYYIRGDIVNLEETVVYNVKKYRKMRGLSQEKLAELCNTSTSYIGLLETGKNIPKLSTIERIAKVLDIEPYNFFRPDEQQDKAKVDSIMKDIKSVLEHYL